MMLRKTSKKGFSIVLVVVVLSSVVIIFSVILSFAIRSYKLQKKREKHTQLLFAARSGIAVTLANLSEISDKKYTGIKDLRAVEEDFFLGGFRVRTQLQDENAKINIKKMKNKKGYRLAGFPFRETEDLSKILFQESEMHSEVASHLIPFVTSFNDGRLNLNTAHRVILGLFFKNKKDLIFFVQSRQDKPLTNLSEMEYIKQDYFRKNIPFSNLPFTIKSNYFTIVSKAYSENQKVVLKAVYKVQDNALKQIYLEKVKER